MPDTLLCESRLREALRESVSEVLERMFFIGSLGELQDSVSESELAAHLTFEGTPSGSLTLRITTAAARSVAADFLGAEECDLSERQAAEVILELANMICGSLLSKVENAVTFRLAAPRIVLPGEDGADALPDAVVHTTGIAGGVLKVIVRTEP